MTAKWVQGGWGWGMGMGWGVVVTGTLSNQIETFQSTERELGLSLRTLRENFTSTKHSSQKEIAKFSDDRIRQHRQVSCSGRLTAQAG